MRTIAVIAAAIMIMGCTSTQKKYTIEGSAVTVESGMVYLLDQQGFAVDSAEVVDGAFLMEGTVEQTDLYFLADGQGEKATFGAQFILEPGRIAVADDPENPYSKSVVGTPSNDAAAAYRKQAQKLLLEYRDAETTEERRAQIEEEFDGLAPAAIEQNNNNFFGVLMLADRGGSMSGDEILAYVEKFPAELQQSELMVRIREVAEAKNNVKAGKPYIDIEFNDRNDTPVSLKSVIENTANKYVLIDFWASWCGPCMAEMPYLKACYEEYHDKGFEIYGVSLDEDKSRWTAAIDNNKMAWVNVSSLAGWDDAAARKYAVRSIPSNFLIDCSTGNIVASNLRGEELQKKVAELLGE